MTHRIKIHIHCSLLGDGKKIHADSERIFKNTLIS